MILTSFALFLGTAVSAAVLKSRPQEAPMPHTTIPARVSDGWHFSVPIGERRESVVVLPFHPALRAVKIVEVFGQRRELLYSEVRS